MDVRVLMTIPFLVVSQLSYALQDLSDEEMLEVSGEGVALVYEDYQFNAQGSELAGSSTDLTFKVTGITDSAGSPVDVSLSHVYIAGPGTNLGADLDGKVVNLGRLNNPYTIDMIDGNTLSTGSPGGLDDGWKDKAVLSIAAPTHVDSSVGYHCTDASQKTAGSGTCSSRPDLASGYHGERADIGIRLNNDFTADPTKNMNINFHGQSVHFDGSYMRFWGGTADVDSDGSDDETMMMEAQINVYADKLIINSCAFDGTNCGNNIVYDQFKLELALGDAKYFQPATFDVNADGNFKFMIQPLPGPGDTRVDSSTPGSWNHGTVGLYGGGHLVPGNPSGAPDDQTDPATYNWYLDYYENGRKTNFSVDNMTVGGENFGSSRITNMQIQYLEVTSHDL